MDSKFIDSLLDKFAIVDSRDLYFEKGLLLEIDSLTEELHDSSFSAHGRDVSGDASVARSWLDRGVIARER